MIRTLKFRGYSDDTFGEYGITNQDCDNCASGEPIQCIVDCGEHGSVLVVGQYGSVSMESGCWLVGLTKTDENKKLPDWNFRYEISGSHCDYSPVLLMDLPDGEFCLKWFIGGREISNP